MKEICKEKRKSHFANEITVENVDDVPGAGSMILSESVLKKISEAVEEEAPAPSPLTKAAKSFERVAKKSVKGISYRRTCCFVFSL